jgi:hypothetical protein
VFCHFLCGEQFGAGIDPSALGQARQARVVLETINTVRAELLGRVRQVLESR